jgi:cell cycle checkpoint protein
VLLLTGLPNLAHLPTREAFHDALAGFCRTYTDASAPLVIVHSDSGAGGRAEESWMDRERGSRDGPAEILGPEVNNSAWSTQIE